MVVVHAYPRALDCYVYALRSRFDLDETGLKRARQRKQQAMQQNPALMQQAMAMAGQQGGMGGMPPAMPGCVFRKGAGRQLK